MCTPCPWSLTSLTTWRTPHCLPNSTSIGATTTSVSKKQTNGKWPSSPQKAYLNPPWCSSASAMHHQCSKPSWTISLPTISEKSGWKSTWMTWRFISKMTSPSTMNEPGKSSSISENMDLLWNCPKQLLMPLRSNSLEWSSAKGKSRWIPRRSRPSETGNHLPPSRESDHSLASLISTENSSLDSPTSLLPWTSSLGKENHGTGHLFNNAPLTNSRRFSPAPPYSLSLMFPNCFSSWLTHP